MNHYRVYLVIVAINVFILEAITDMPTWEIGIFLISFVLLITAWKYVGDEKNHGER